MQPSGPRRRASLVDSLPRVGQPVERNVTPPHPAHVSDPERPVSFLSHSAKGHPWPLLLDDGLDQAEFVQRVGATGEGTHPDSKCITGWLWSAADGSS